MLITGPRLVVLATAFAMACITHAQEQERKLMERIQNPDRTLISPMQTKVFSGTSSAPTGDFHGGSRSFNVTDKAAVKMFSGARSFFGLKNPWFGSKVFPSSAAPLGRGGNSSLSERVFPVGNAAVKISPLASNKSKDANKAVETGEFSLRGEAQGAFDQITDRVHQEMTIDDVRELLNNPR